MSVFYQFFELFATFTEGLIVLSVSGNMCGRRYSKGKNILLILIFTVIYTALITYMNTVQLFSYATITAAILYSIAVNFILNKGHIVLRAASLMVTWFFMHALDYVLSYSIILLIGRQSNIFNGFILLMGEGIYRVIFLLVDKLIQILIFYIFRGIYPRAKLLGKKNLLLLFVISAVAYIMMSVLTGLIITDSIITIQVAAIFSIFFIVVSLVATIAAVSVNTSYEKEKRETALMAMTNTMMEKNFAELQNSQSAIRQQVHDFKNHIRTISGMIEKDEGAKAYIDELLSVSYEQAHFCNCGNKVIDSIINCKIMEAKTLDVPFEHRVILRTPLHLSSVDICAVLANQIDNAIEACSKVPEDEDRFITTEIWQKESFVFFKVTNTCIENPFNAGKELKSTKEDPSGMHGFGIKNISRTVERYGGTLKNEYKNGCFTSVAMIPNNE